MKIPAMAADAHAHRVVRSFGFLDLCGFTDFAETHGDESAVAQLRGLRSLVREVAPLCGVRVDKWLGDGVMLVGVDAEPLVDAVAAVVDRWHHAGGVALRAGVATGPVLILDGDDYVGRAVNIAARLCDRAGADEILVAIDGTSIPAWAEAGPAEAIVLKGFAEPIDAVSLRATSEAGGGRTAMMALVEGLVRPFLPRREPPAA